MSRPYLIYPQASYRITFRCAQRRCLLTPGEDINEAIGFWLAYTLARHGLLLHAFCVMSNHIHLDVTDPHGNVVAFTRDFKAVGARMLNSMRGKWESFWAPGRGGRARVVQRYDAAHGLAYTITNPVAAGLVANPKAWPGLISTPADIEAAAGGGRSWTFKRPGFFRTEEQGGSIAATATLTLVPHPLAGEDAMSFAKDVAQRVRKLVGDKVAAVRNAGGRFAGAAAVLRTSPERVPSTHAPRRTLNPRWACKDPELRRQLLALDRQQQEAYQEARCGWLSGESVVFPFGTFQLRGCPGVIVAREGPLAF